MSNSDISSRESISRLNISLIDEDLAFEIDDFEAVEEQTSRTHEDIPRKNPGKNLTAKPYSKLNDLMAFPTVSFNPKPGYLEKITMEEIQMEFQKNYLKTKVLSRQYQFSKLNLL